MKLSIHAQSATLNTSDCIVLPLLSSSKLLASTAEVDKASKGFLIRLIRSKDISNRFGNMTLLLHVPGIKATRVLVVGLSKSAPYSVSDFQTLYRKLITELEKTPAQNVSSYLLDDALKFDTQRHASIASETLLNSDYRFNAHKSRPSKEASIKRFQFFCKGSVAKKKLNTALKKSNALVQGINLCKDLGNLPGNVCTPSYLADTAQKMSTQAKVKVKVIDEKSFARMGMGAFLSVAKGSEQSAKLITIHYEGGKKGDKPHVLVGKGITFDSGGISLKPGSGMDEMKYDMCGAASVLGAMQTIISSKLKLNVVAIIAAAENMPSSRASKPGDIVTSMSGLTIEILNTDAEGRLVLCDALTYAEQFKPASVIDVATLTGACVVALGSHATALYTNNEAMGDKLKTAGETAWDRVWPMPLWPEYDIQLKSRFADLANIGGPKAGSITAACFLANFTKQYKWAHLDIAGTAWFGPGPSKGSTGRPVPLLVEYLSMQVK